MSTTLFDAAEDTFFTTELTDETLVAADEVLEPLELEDLELLEVVFDENDDANDFSVVAGLMILLALLIKAAFAASFAA